MTPVQIVLDTDITALDARIEWNGIAFVNGEVASSRRAVRLNGWTVRGENRLIVQLALLPSPARPPRCELRLRAISGGEEQELTRYTWNAANAPLAPRARQTVLQRSFPLEPVAEWSWTHAAQVRQPTPLDANAIADVLERQRNALAAGDIDAVVAAQDIQLSEQATAGGLDPGAARQSYREFLAERMAQPDWSVLPFDRIGLRVDPMADGRIQHVTDRAGGPPVRALGGGGTFALDPYLAKLAGQWTIVR
jgi:hypothetical protein